jgi:YVTN family beta-propeller protein
MAIKGGMSTTRRRFLAGSVGAAAAQLGCGPSKHQALRAYAFVANSEGSTVAVADLATFAVARQISMDDQPSAVIAPAGRSSVYVLTPHSGSLHEIAVQQLKVQRTLRLGQSAVSMQLSPDEKAVYVLLAQPKKLVRVALDSFTADWELPLPMAAIGFDLDKYFDQPSKGYRQVGAVSYGAAGGFAFFDPADRKLFPMTKLDGELGAVRFQYGRELIVANLSARSLSVYDTFQRKRMVELPLKNRPDQLCFSADAGQLFVTGEGSDAVSIVYPMRTPEVAETVLAGRQPGAMAVTSGSPAYLFIANPSSGDVSIINADHRVIAVVSVGAEPCFITTTPNSDFALVLNRKSGDMAVLRIGTITRNRLKSASLFTMIPVGSAPVSAAVQML